MQRRLVPHGLELSLPPSDPLPKACDARLELRALDQALGIAVDQPAHAPAQLGRLRLGRGKVRAIRSPTARLIKAPFILRGDPGRIVQQPLNLTPDRLVQPVGADLTVRAQALAAKAVSVAAAAAIVGVVTPMALGSAQADRLAVIGIPASVAHQKALQEVARAPGALPAPAAVLGELLAHGVEQRRVD